MPHLAASPANRRTRTSLRLIQGKFQAALARQPPLWPCNIAVQVGLPVWCQNGWWARQRSVGASDDTVSDGRLMHDISTATAVRAHSSGCPPWATVTVLLCARGCTSPSGHCNRRNTWTQKPILEYDIAWIHEYHICRHQRNPGGGLESCVSHRREMSNQKIH